MNIVLIGSGNMATQLGKAWTASGDHQIVQVYNRTQANAEALACALNTHYTSNIGDILTDADIYLIAVSDSSIRTIADLLPEGLKGIILHCSGATSIDELSRFKNYGVIYPVQSISKTVDISFKQVPIGIEFNNETIKNNLFNLIDSISDKAFSCSSDQRLAIHISAVFANNFSNALFQISKDILDQHHLDFDLIRPIILETAKKVQNHFPEAVQTGPAIRNDKITMKKHLDFISSNQDWQSIYQKISALIAKRTNNNS